LRSSAKKTRSPRRPRKKKLKTVVNQNREAVTIEELSDDQRRVVEARASLRAEAGSVESLQDAKNLRAASRAEQPSEALQEKVGELIEAAVFDEGRTDFTDIVGAVYSNLVAMTGDPEKAIRVIGKIAKPLETAWPQLVQIAANAPGDSRMTLTGTPNVRQAMLGITKGQEQAPLIGSIDDPQWSELRLILIDYLKSGARFRTRKDLMDYVARLFFGEDTNEKLPDNIRRRVAEVYEQATVAVADEIILKAGEKAYTDPAVFSEVYNKLVEIYQSMPLMHDYTAESKELQQFSTPIPMAFAAQVLGGVTRFTPLFDPTAGHGALLIGRNGSLRQGNEIDKNRYDGLLELGMRSPSPSLGHSSSNQDALSPTVDGGFLFRLMNPPFGTKTDPKNPSQKKVWQIPVEGGQTFITDQIDHAIVVKFLKGIATGEVPGAVAIIGSGNLTEVNKGVRYNSDKWRKFWSYVRDHYDVPVRLTLSGKLYARQGSAWPVDLFLLPAAAGGPGKGPVPGC